MLGEEGEPFPDYKSFQSVGGINKSPDLFPLSPPQAKKKIGLEVSKIRFLRREMTEKIGIFSAPAAGELLQ